MSRQTNPHRQTTSFGMIAILLIHFAFSVNLVCAQTSSEKSSGNNNFYPHFRPGSASVIKHIEKSGHGIGEEISLISPLNVNGKIHQGTVLTKWPGHNDANIDVYHIKVDNEGLLSVVAKPLDCDEETGSLSLEVYGNDSRMEGGIVLKKISINSCDKYARDDGGRIVDSYSFYAYPGTYYLRVDGKSRQGEAEFFPLTYQVGLVQDAKIDRYSGGLGKEDGRDFPDDLGKTILNDKIEIVSSLGLENWKRIPTDSSLAKKSARTHTNTRDKFWFTPSTSGKVYFHVSSFSSDAMEVWQRAWRKAKDRDISLSPLFRVSVMHERVKNHVLVDKRPSFDGSLDVVAGGNYLVSVSSEIDRPAYYRLYISYSDKVPPLETAIKIRPSDTKPAVTTPAKSR